MAITKEQVFEVCGRLDSEGKAPTLAAVRKELGSGSFTTISAMVAEWRKSGLAVVEVDGVEMPSAVAEAVAEAGRVAWKMASQVAMKQWEKERAELMAKLEEANKERDEALTIADEQRAQTDRHQQALEECGQQLKIATEGAIGLKAALAERTGQVEMLQAAVIGAERRIAIAEQDLEAAKALKTPKAKTA